MLCFQQTFPQIFLYTEHFKYLEIGQLNLVMVAWFLAWTDFHYCPSCLINWWLLNKSGQNRLENNLAELKLWCLKYAYKKIIMWIIYITCFNHVLFPLLWFPTHKCKKMVKDKTTSAFLFYFFDWAFFGRN